MTGQRRLTETGKRRALMFASGASYKEISEAEGVSYNRVRESVRGFVHTAAERVTYPCALPSGMRWYDRGESKNRRRPAPRWYAYLHGYTTLEQVRWAIALLDERTTERPIERPACTACGRPF